MVKKERLKRIIWISVVGSLFYVNFMSGLFS